MANYLLLYSGGSMPESEAAQKSVMDAWGAWFGKLGDALVDGGNPFSGKSKTIGPDQSVKDGSGGSTASGYSVIKAGSIDEATNLAKDCPVTLGGASIMVFETFEVM